MVREVGEETGLSCRALKLFHCFVRPRAGPRDIFVAVYVAHPENALTNLRLSSVHGNIGFFGFLEISEMEMNHGCRETLKMAATAYGQ